MNSKILHHPNYRTEIDGLRAFAVLFVVLFHAFPEFIPGGFIGVDIFFVISGYLITAIILTSLHQKTFTFSSFIKKRILRIFPGLIVVLLVTIGVLYFIYPTTNVPYLLNPVIHNYFWSNLKLFDPTFYIPGVFDHLPSRAIL